MLLEAKRLHAQIKEYEVLPQQADSLMRVDLKIRLGKLSIILTWLIPGVGPQQARTKAA